MRIRLRTVVLDCPDAHILADFYSRLLGYPMAMVGNSLFISSCLLVG